MNERIIYPNADGGVSVIIPAPEFADQLVLVAIKDVPAGKPWRIVNEQDLPSREFRDRWLWTDEGPLAIKEE